jgi:hypothetical protein
LFFNSSVESERISGPRVSKVGITPLEYTIFKGKKKKKTKKTKKRI